MKIKLSWFAFVPICILVTVLSLVQSVILNKEGSVFLGLNNVSASYTSIFLTVLLAILCKMFSMFDRETSHVYFGRKSVFLAVFACLIAVLVLLNGILVLMDQISSEQSTFSFLKLFEIIFSFIAATAFFVIGMFHITNKSLSVNGFPILALATSLWSCIKVLTTFVGYTTISIASNDMTDLIVFVLLTLYLFWNAVVVSKIANKESVKACFVFGMPLIALSLDYCIKIAIGFFMHNSSIRSFDYLNAVLFFLVALYTVVSLADYTKYVHNIEDDLPLLGDYSQELKMIKKKRKRGYVSNFVKDSDTSPALDPMPSMEEDISKRGVIHDFDFYDEKDNKKGKKAEDNSRMREIDRLIKDIERGI